MVEGDLETHRTTSERLFELWSEVHDLAACERLLTWDQETYMPVRGHAGRGKVLATVAGLLHERLTSPELRDCLDACQAAAEPGSTLAAQVREARRSTDRAHRVPPALVRALAETSSNAIAAWKAAREEARFASFAPQLERMVELKRQEAAAVAPEAPPYDALLDEYEPGATAAALAPLFRQLGDRLSGLVAQVRQTGIEIDDAPLLGSYPTSRQLELGRWVAERIGFDFGGGRIDTSIHPFCVGLHAGDVRLTWTQRSDDFRPALFGLLHEAGHGLYEQGLPEALRRTPIGGAVSLGVHESQSRLWENLVGRSRSFWRAILPRFHELFPDRGGLDVDTLWPRLHAVRPSAIRVFADETTYNLHIAIRFELEAALLSGDLAVEELPAAWNTAYERDLGVRPESDVDGVLQDIHWASGLFGYFPTYTLGTLLSSQLWQAAEDEIGPLAESIGEADFRPLLDWLRREVHTAASRYPPEELVRRATGTELAATPFLDRVCRHAAEIYGI